MDVDAALEGYLEDLAGCGSLAEVQAVLRSAPRHLVGADGATFVLREGEECYYADEDAASPLWKGQRFPVSACISGWAMLHGRPALIPDITVDPRIPQEAYRPTFVRSLVMVPIGSPAVAALGAYWDEVREPSVVDVVVLSRLASAAADAIAALEAPEMVSEAS